LSADVRVLEKGDSRPYRDMGEEANEGVYTVIATYEESRPCLIQNPGAGLRRKRTVHNRADTVPVAGALTGSPVPNNLTDPCGLSERRN